MIVSYKKQISDSNEQRQPFPLRPFLKGRERGNTDHIAFRDLEIGLALLNVDLKHDRLFLVQEVLVLQKSVRFLLPRLSNPIQREQRP